MASRLGIEVRLSKKLPAIDRAKRELLEVSQKSSIGGSALEAFHLRIGKPNRMCEYCNKTDVIIEKLDSDEQFPCEWISEEEGPGACDQQAAYAVSEWYVEDHLCDAHKENTEKEMEEEGLGEFLESAGFRSQFEIRPIEQDETCDYFAPDSPDWEPCGEKATFAKYILDSSLVCAEHAAEINQKSEKT